MPWKSRMGNRITRTVFHMLSVREILMHTAVACSFTGAITKTWKGTIRTWILADICGSHRCYCMLQFRL